MTEIISKIEIITSREPDGKIKTSVAGHSSNHEAALMMLHNAIVIVSRQFVKAAKEGNIDENLTITESKVLVRRIVWHCLTVKGFQRWRVEGQT